MKKKVKKEAIAVVVPIYKKPDRDEWRSLDQCYRLLNRSGYPMILAKPEKLDVSGILEEFPGVGCETFENKWFDSLESYNRLVLTEMFYTRFSAYEYMLVYQLDAYVFRGGDELQRWCSRGYDYIGAPWMPYKKIYLNPLGRTYLNVMFKIFNKLRGTIHHDFHRNQVGNGGLSLRKIDKFLEITRKYRNLFDDLLSDGKPFYPEDLILLYELEGTPDRLKKPSFNKAIRFSFEENPGRALRYTGGKLPFGCHAWSHPAYKQFWTQFI